MRAEVKHYACQHRAEDPVRGIAVSQENLEIFAGHLVHQPYKNDAERDPPPHRVEKFEGCVREMVNIGDMQSGKIEQQRG